MTYNIMNLNHPEEPEHYDKKSLAQRERMLDVAEVINELNPDVLTLEEVVNFETALHLNNHFLDGAFNVFFFEGNTRGASIAFLVRKTLPFNIETQSYKNTKWIDPVSGKKKKLFTRDAPSLQFLRDDDSVAFSLIGVHLKSKNNRRGDEESRLLRGAEVRGVINIVNELEDQTKAPVIVSGDFNYDLRSSENPELLDTLTDSFDLTDPPVRNKKRATFVYLERVKKKQIPRNRQLDAILITDTPDIEVIHAEVYFYTDEVDPYPKTSREKSDQPSDHFPVYTDIRIAS